MWKCKEWWNIELTLGIWYRHLSQHSLPPARHQPHLLIPSVQTIDQKKAKNPEMRFNSQQIVLYCLGLCTQNTGLREVDLELSPKRDSDKINMLKWGTKTAEENKSYRTAWTHMWIRALREVDLKPSVQRGANRTEALVSVYWLSQSLHPKEPPNQISHTSAKVDSTRSSRTWKKSYQISKFYALQHIKTFFLRNTRSTNAHDSGYKWGCHVFSLLK